MSPSMPQAATFHVRTSEGIINISRRLGGWYSFNQPNSADAVMPSFDTTNMTYLEAD